MPRRPFLRSLLLGLLLAALPLSAQTLERFLDAPRPAPDGLRLVVFNPTPYNIRCLAALRRLAILDVPNLTVVGVYHVRQKEDFAQAQRYAREAGLDWFKFHAVSAPVGEAELWRRNACTPEFEAVAQKADGAVFFGGPDIPSSIFGRKTHLLVDIEDPHRHYLELSAIFHLLGGAQDPARTPLLQDRPAFPVLGICLGFQSLNVATGGTLVQDIPSERYGLTYVEDVIAQGQEQWHNNPYKRLHPQDKLMPHNFHTLNLGPEGRIFKPLGFGADDHPRVLSSHHQALGALGQGWVATAFSRDGKVVEAIEHRRFPNVLGVQFHPEHHQLWDAGTQVRQRPGDVPTTYPAILASTPRSLEFNQAIWKWLGAKLQEGRK